MNESETFEQANDEAFQASTRAPVEKSWGLYAQPANPEPANEEPGHFLWFDDREAMLDFLAKHAVRWACMVASSEGEDVLHVCEAAAKIVQRVRDAEQTLPEAMEELSDWLFEYNMEFSWAGPYTELLSGDGEFPKEVRAWFRRLTSGEPVARPEDGQPLRQEEFLDFLQVLEEYEAAEPDL